jgi:hypothetical protein
MDRVRSLVSKTEETTVLVGDERFEETVKNAPSSSAAAWVGTGFTDDIDDSDEVESETCVSRKESMGCEIFRVKLVSDFEFNPTVPLVADFLSAFFFAL